MKQLTTILLAFLLFTAAKCQEPDTLTYYSIEYVDSLKADYEQRIENLSSVITSDTFETSQDTCTLIADDGIIKAEIVKEGLNIWVNIIHEYKRINADYYNGNRSVMIMDSTYTVGSLYINN